MIGVFKLIGALGLILICVGILIKSRKSQSVYFIIGAICLEIYSIYIGDLIFIVLQGVFILAALYGSFFKKDK